MQTLERLTASDLVAVVTSYRDALRAHQERINRLNVYPVPDGDTGTNMALTLEAVVRELAERDSRRTWPASPRPSATGRSWGRGATPGSSCRRSCVVWPTPSATPTAIDAGGADGRAWPGPPTAPTRPSSSPVEGTILTVARAAADAAAPRRPVRSRAGRRCSRRPARARHEALARTPELLPVLKAAGVVDAGGAGLRPAA